MSEFTLDAAAVIHTRDQKVESLLADFAFELKDLGVSVKGVVQRNTPDPDGGHDRMDLIDIETGEMYGISQKLGRAAGSCHLDQSGLASASTVLRRAVEARPALLVANRFGEQEATGRGFADEMLAAMSEGIPMVTAVGDRWREQWQTFTGGAATLLPPTPLALRRWFEALGKDAQGDYPGSVLTETVRALSSILGEEMNTLVVERAVVGQFFTAVKLNNGSTGACHSPAKALITSECCASLPKSVLLAGHLKGRPVGEFLADLWEDLGNCRALGIAVINALAETAWRRRPAPGWKMITGVDALKAAGLRPEEKMVMVGAFVSYIRALKTHHEKLAVLELTTAPFLPDELRFYIAADKAPEVVPTADVLLMTGSTIVNDTMDDLLALARPDARVMVVGPSTPMLPDVLAAKGADLLATIRINDGDRFLDVLAEGGGTQGVFDKSAELVVLSRDA